MKWEFLLEIPPLLAYSKYFQYCKFVQRPDGLYG